MSVLLDKHAVVVGAGIGGLAAAMALSTLFGTVTVLERDALPETPAPRIGTPQCRLVHILLAGGLRALTNYFPDIEDDFIRAGAVRARVGSEIRLEIAGFDPFPKRPFDFYSTCMSRPRFEWVLRQRVERVPNITIHTRRRATQLVVSENGAVCGVMFEGADGNSGTVKSDLVIDASLRGDLTLDILDRLSLARPTEDEIGVDVGYATTVFEKPSDRHYDWKLLIQRPDIDNGRSGFITPIEDNLWHVNLAGINGDHPPDNMADYFAFAESLRMPTLFDAIKDAKVLSPIHRYILRSSIRRRFENLAVFPDGVVPVGDAICRINPAYGQGMSVAAQEVDALRQLLVERADSSDPLSGLPRAFFARIGQILEGPWAIGEQDFAFAKTRGRRPQGIEQKLRQNAMLLRAAAERPAVHKLWAEVTNLLVPASQLSAIQIAV